MTWERKEEKRDLLWQNKNTANLNLMYPIEIPAQHCGMVGPKYIAGVL